ncbi:glutamate synthase large subunit [Candidatus Sumerlaeota bacterium]|nr:glutamate synthase large subunit [Candidatus Sumerlaeota bacterium]
MTKPTIEGLPAPIGLYNPESEHDACGIGFVANIDGNRTHEIVQLALRALVNLTHRGAIDMDARTGDGAGLLTQIPYKLFRKDLASWGVTLKDDSSLGVGMIFFPLEDELAREKCRLIVEESLRHYELEFHGWREVPVDRSAIGDKADDTRPQIEQVLFGKPESMSDAEFDDTIFLCRKVIEGSVLQRGIPGFYICSMSARTIVYKGMFVAPQLPVFFKDLKSPLFETAIAVLHQRYSTNTFPQWRLAQPFRMTCHNGEINTLAGNKNWTQARERQYSKDLILGARIRKIMPIIQPGGSDSAAFDNVLESIVHSERSIVHALSMLMPPAWEHHDEMPRDQKDFYKYHSTLAEPWDGPAAIAFTDGRIVGATLDRNGLRPARYKITKGNQIVFASEVGVINLTDDEVIEKGRLGPGKMIAIDTQTGTIYRNDELKSKLAGREDYGKWLKKNLQEYPGDDTVAAPAVKPATEGALSLVTRQKMYGYTHEDVRRVLFTMFKSGKEAIGAMGDDTPLAVLSARAKPLHHFFKQRFAQVTNPPIDPIRESAVMSLFVNIGRRGSMYSESPEHARMLRLASPVLTPAAFAWIEKQGEREDFRVGRIDATFEIAGGTQALDDAVTAVCQRGEKLIADGATILILSDRNISAARAPIPSLLAVGALHHHLIRVGRRLSASIIAESGETRDPHLFASLLGYGAAAVYPFVIYEEIASLCEKTPDLLDSLSYAEVVGNFVDAMNASIEKIMSKMGISTLASYTGAQIFESIGLDQALIERAFTGTPSIVSGVGLAEVCENYTDFHKAALETQGDDRLQNEGLFMFKSKGEHHAYNPGVVKALHKAVKNRGWDEYKAFANGVDSQPPTSLRDLLRFRSDREELDIDDVEPIESIMKRFCTAAMSLGSLSAEAHETLAIAMNRIGGKSNSGEGGEDAARYRPDENGDLRNSAIKQVASARFGVTPEYLSSAKVLEIKMAQGSKPGEGGQIPGIKVSEEIAHIRHSVAGVTLISPPPHHDIYSIEDLAQLIADLKTVNPRAKISVKLVAEAGVGTIAAGVAKASADIIHISGHEGGTGASPLSSIKHAGSAWELGLAEAHQVLVLNNMRGHVTLRTDGGLRTGRDVLIAALLGAEEYIFGTAALIATGCVMARQCHLNTCPVGVATQRRDLRDKYSGTPEQLVQYFQFLAQDIREQMAKLGYDNLNEIIGRVDLLEQFERPDCARSKTLDLKPMLAVVDPDRKRAQRRIRPRNNNSQMHTNVDDTLIQDAQDIIRQRKGHMTLKAELTNTDRTVGGKLAGEIAFLHGDAGLADAEIEVNFTGTAGQSFGAFCVHGMRLRLVGEANDYVGKSMAGGEIVVVPPADAAYKPEENSVVGNTCLYGATGGSLFVCGRAGERFGVRLSGAKAVVEGVGEHACEYMTGGLVVILGDTGRNFGAGMTGGLAFVYDKNETLARRYNDELIEIVRVTDDKDVHTLKVMITAHLEKTDSSVARRILDNWDVELKHFYCARPFPPQVAEAVSALPETVEQKKG